MSYKELHIKFIQDIIALGFTGDGLKIVLNNSDTWDMPLPEELKDGKSIVLDIKGQSLVDSFVDKSGVFISTAFGDDINTKLFTFDDIIQVITFEGAILYQKTLILNEPKAEVKTHKSLSNKAHAKMDTKGLEYSMKKLRNLNKHL